jgi:hypothetical protein
MKTLLASLILVAGCTQAQLTAFDSAIAQGQAALVPAQNLACAAATDLDPSGATAICTTIDTAGNAVGLGFTVAEDVASIAALLSATAPKTASATAALTAAKQAVKAKMKR